MLQAVRHARLPANSGLLLAVVTKQRMPLPSAAAVNQLEGDAPQFIHLCPRHPFYDGASNGIEAVVAC